MEFLTKAREVFYDYEEEVEEDSRSPSLILPPPSMIEKEHMFDKVVTPSDVGKLNRLVIPKQHAERYFPLDASTNEKGLQLNFEDPSGKPWRFRYSYWNSSQSYVMTKGWSRFVKEKRLDAGDTVSFCRGVGESGRNRLFIDWKRRPGGIHLARFPLGFQGYHHHNLHQHRRELSSYVMPFSRSTVPLMPIPLSGSPSIGYYNRCGFNPYMVYLRSEIGPSPVGVQLGIRGEREEEEEEEDDVSVMQRKGSSKTVRLFGVDLDCPTSRVSDSDGKFGDQGRPFLASLQLKLGRSEMEECLDI